MFSKVSFIRLHCQVICRIFGYFLQVLTENYAAPAPQGEIRQYTPISQTSQEEVQQDTPQLTQPAQQGELLQQQDSLQPSQNPQQGEVRQYTPIPPAPVKDLLLKVDRVGSRTEQVVDNQQGQVVKQTVLPDGIRQTVYFNGKIITDDLVKRPVAPITSGSSSTA